eukprot:g17891.t1
MEIPRTLRRRRKSTAAEHAHQELARLRLPRPPQIRLWVCVLLSVLSRLLLPVSAQATYPSEFKLEYCTPDGNCHVNLFSCPHFQLKLWSFYRRRTVRPPLKQAWFLLGLPHDYREELIYSCPGGMVVASFLTATASLYTNPERAKMYFTVGLDLLANKLPDVHKQVALDSFPVHEAHDFYVDTLERMLREEAALKEGMKKDERLQQSLDLVIVHCREGNLGWLSSELVWPNGVLGSLRLFVYEKCGANADLYLKNSSSEQQGLSTLTPSVRDEILTTRYNVSATFGERIKALHVLTVADADDVVIQKETRRDECSAYTNHVLQHVHSNSRKTSAFERQKYLWENREYLAEDIMRFAQQENLKEAGILDPTTGRLAEDFGDNVTKAVEVLSRVGEQLPPGLASRAQGTTTPQQEPEKSAESRSADHDHLQAAQNIKRESDQHEAEQIAQTLGDYTIFLHADPISHWGQFGYSYLNLILASLAQGRLDVKFMHLSTPRLVAVSTPCQDQVYHYILGKSLLPTKVTVTGTDTDMVDETGALKVDADESGGLRQNVVLGAAAGGSSGIRDGTSSPSPPGEPTAADLEAGAPPSALATGASNTATAVLEQKPRRLLETYCCAQFMVSKKQLLSIPYDRLERLQQIVDGSIPDLCMRVGPTYEKYRGQRLSYCYSLEFMWHVILGDKQPEEKLRSDDPEVPLFLRWKDNEEAYPLWREPHSYYVMKTEYLRPGLT